MDDATILSAVATIAKDRSGAVAAQARLAEDLHIDSMARIELAVLLEDQLGRPVPDAVVMKAKTVSDLIAELGT